MTVARPSAVSFLRSRSRSSSQPSLRSQGTSPSTPPLRLIDPLPLRRSPRVSRSSPSSPRFSSPVMTQTVSPPQEQRSSVPPSPQSSPIPLQRKKQPIWLQLIHVLYYASSSTTLILIAFALGLYGWTVYTQQTWSEAYRTLENLQRQERQLTITNETLKNSLAENAEQPEAGLVPPNPHTTIFLTPAPDELKVESSSVPEKSSHSEQPMQMPLGY